MHPTVARSNRSSLQSSIPSTTTPSSVLHQHPPQQIQQQIIYGPIANPLVSLQPCATSLHPSCIYPGTQRNAGLSSPIPLHMQGKNNRWPSKNKLLRSHQQYCQQQQQQQQIIQQQQQQQIIQQQLPYTPKPIVLFDQSSNNAPVPPSTTSFLVASSTFTHGPYPGEQYSNSGVTLIPQPYFKPPDLQTYCLLQDRQPTQQQEQPSHDSYYNISANTCSLQAVNANSAFQFPNLGPYAAVATFTNNQISGPLQGVPSTQIFPNPHVNLIYSGSQRERPSSLSTIDISTFKCTRKLPVANASQYPPNLRAENNDWPAQAITSSNSLFDLKTNDEVNNDTIEVPSQKTISNVSNKTQEEHYSDESSASFDFTIEAEKMVSALCNTTSSNDLGKMEVRDNMNESVPLFSGAGDTATNKSTWFTDLCTNYGSKSVGIQTDGPCADSTQFPELIRKAAYWGCTEAEILLNNNLKTDPRCGWLKNISSATRTAVTKSSTCFPIFAGDRVFVGDLINALLRICNGWLILDNYLNKQHYPSLDNKFDQELVRSFQIWEWNTYELINEIIQTFLKLDETSEDPGLDNKSTELPGTSFPGDVSLYTNCDLFEPSSSAGNLRQQSSSNRNNNQESMFNTSDVTSQLSTGSLRNFRLCETNQQRQQQPHQKDAKLRSKWTVTENQTSTIDVTKSVPDMFSGNTEAGSNTTGILRTKGVSSSCSKLDSSTQSLNAEFHHLRSKVLESNPDTSRDRIGKDKKAGFFERKIPTKTESFDSMLQSQRPLTHRSSENLGTQKYVPGADSFSNPASINFQSVYFATSTDTASGLESSYAVCTPYAMTNCNAKNFKNIEQAYENKASNVDSVYVGKSSSNQLELSAVPKDKMTLLSQIEPNIPDKASEQMTANLSAWFASMRNFNEHRQAGSVTTKLPARQEVSKNTIDLVRQLQIDTNRQLQTLQNMQSIQNAPWNACNLITNGVQVQQGPDEYDSSEDVRVYMKPGSYNVPKKRHQRRSNRRLDNSSVQRNAGVGGHRNYYSGKDKTLCTPASSTPVPRSTASSVSANNNSNISAAMKLTFPATPIARSPVILLENSPRILKRMDSPSNEVSRDITWKTACASAEILLEALNVKEDASVKSYKEMNSNDVTGEMSNNESNNIDVLQAAQNPEKSQESLSKASKHAYDDCAEASSYEASEDDSGSTSRLSHNASYVEISQSSENKNGSNKTNVKTDSWLIRTLNNASIVSKQKRRKNNNNRHSSESSNSSIADNEQETPISSLTAIDAATTAAAKTTIEKHQPIAYPRENVSTPTLKDNHISTEECERVVGKATYSETVRRSAPLSTSYSGKKDFSKKSKLNLASTSTICSTMVPIPGRRCQRRDPERSYHILHKSRKSTGKKTLKMYENNDPRMEERARSKSRVSRHGTSKENLCVVSTITSKLTSTKSHGKKKENLNGSGELLGNKFPVKSSDRGWSVWYSSKRKQSLSPLALSKLEMIHQTVWKMEEAQIFKYPSPSSNFTNQSTSADTIEDYCKVIKSPMFLETVGYKLKNRAYHKVEHVIGDFRRIVHNSKLYHKDDHDRVNTIDSLSEKLEQLFEEHFSSWDFGNISPREVSPMSHRLKSMEQKPVAGCYGNTKKALPPLSPQKTYHFGDIYLSE